MQPEIDAAGRDEIDLAELAGVDQALDRGHGRAVQERVSRHQHEAVLLSDCGEVESLLAGSGEGLLDEDVLSGLQSGHCERVMRRDRGRDHDCVHLVVREHVLEARRAGSAREALSDRLERVWTNIAKVADREVGQLGQVPSDVGPPVPEAHNRDPNRLGRPG